MGKVMDTLRSFRRPKQIDLEEYLSKLHDRRLTDDGKLVPDSTPMAPPIGYKKAPSMVEVVRSMVQSEHLARAARDSGHETFEEAEDFEVGDEPEMASSPWENEFDPPIRELLEAGREALAKKKEAADAAGKAGEPGAGGGSQNNPPPSPGDQPAS